MQAIIDKGEYTGAPVLGGQNQFEVLNKVADGIDVKGKITPYDVIIKNAFSTAVYSYCDGTYYSVDDAMEAFRGDVASQVVDGINWDDIDDDYDSVDWCALYAPIINKYKSESTAMYELRDLNFDGIPELAVSLAQYHVAPAQLYTVYDNELVDVGALGEYGEFKFSSDSGLICTVNGGMGYFTTTYYSLEYGKLKKVKQFFSNAAAYPEGSSSIYYEVDGVKVSKSTYDKAVKDFDANCVYDRVGRINKITTSIYNASVTY